MKQTYDHTDIVEFIHNNPDVGIKLAQGKWTFTLRKFEEVFAEHGFFIEKPKSSYLLGHKDSETRTQLRSVKQALKDIYNWSISSKQNKN